MNTLTDKELNLEQQAGEWFVLIQSNSATEQELACFFQWLEADERHLLAYQEYGEIWEDLPSCSMETQAQSIKSSRGDKVAQTRLFGTVQVFSKARITYALTSLAAALLLAWMLFPFSPSRTQATYTTDIGEIREIALNDGSVLTLGADSQIHITMSNKTRQVDLTRGQAYFDVSSRYDNQGRKIPFAVISRAMRINVVGTQFAVNLLKEKAQVSVIEGEVHVDHVSINDKPIVLTQGQAVVAIGPQLENLGDPADADIQQALSWKNGWLSYTDANLRDVIADASRYHKGRIELDDPSLELLRVTTSFRTDQIAQMTHILETVLPVKVYHGENERIVIAPDRRVIIKK